eukprot:TRINITY_DN52622_c0_g1_i1.p3 TRINITY_DN52622_c0_g1~~TRINITY_DN52622_c0_g1_i1.p3  ORF type:complete len:135 (+),score=9.14 TRINITY_DN52622_c0_g1_i1:551-955(+)
MSQSATANLCARPVATRLCRPDAFSNHVEGVTLSTMVLNVVARFSAGRVLITIGDTNSQTAMGQVIRRTQCVRIVGSFSRLVFADAGAFVASWFPEDAAGLGEARADPQPVTRVPGVFHAENDRGYHPAAGEEE